MIFDTNMGSALLEECSFSKEDLSKHVHTLLEGMRTKANKGRFPWENKNYIVQSNICCKNSNSR